MTLDGSPVDVDTRKAIALLAYLAVEEAADRDVLATLLWSSSTADRARATLRRTLSALRAGIGAEAVEADRNQVRLVPPLHLDLDEFEKSIEQTEGHGHDSVDVCAACIAPLQRAIDLYRGDFLGAFAIRDAPDFEEWARTVTESMRLRAGEASRRLATAYASEGDYPAALETINRWISLDELHEPAYRMAMLVCAWAGDRAGAIQAYRDCVAILDNELGVPPLDETTELYEAILDDDLPPSPGPRRQVRAHTEPDAPEDGSMIDRRQALEVAESALSNGEIRPRLLVISGESWMGKTRLLESVVAMGRRRGHLAASAACYRAEVGLPYGVAVQLLGVLTQAVDAHSVPEWVWVELSRLNPRLAPPGGSPDKGQLGQLRLLEAFVALVEAVATDRPVVVAVDDCQWMDKASAGVIEYLSRRAGQARVLVVISARDTDDLQPALREAAADADWTVELGPLREKDLEAEHPESDLSGILRQTGGIPLLVAEALEAGQVSPHSSTVAKYMESRRSRLSELSRQVLTTAAVLDGMCDTGLLRETSGRTEEEIVEAVEELVAAGLLREHEDDRLTFTLDVLESLTYESTSLIRRRLLHRRAAAALAARPRSTTDARLATATAEHMRAAGAVDSAVWYRLAGDLSREVFANDEAAHSYETAIALGHPDLGPIRLALGELALARGDYEDALVELRTAAAHARGELLARVEHRIGGLNRMLGRFDQAEESFANAEPEHPAPSELYADWALLKHRLGDDASAVELARRAESAAVESGDDRALSRALNILGLVTKDLDEATTFIDRALELADSDEPSRMAALNNKAYLLSLSDQDGLAVDLVNQAVDIAARAGFRHHQAALLNHLADLHHHAGQEEEAMAAQTEAVTLFADIAAGDWEPEVWLLRQW